MNAIVGMSGTTAVASAEPVEDRTYHIVAMVNNVSPRPETILPAQNVEKAGTRIKSIYPDTLDTPDDITKTSPSR
jgi:hypothetical protein